MYDWLPCHTHGMHSHENLACIHHTLYQWLTALVNIFFLALLRGSNAHLLFLPVPRSIAGVVALSPVHQKMAERHEVMSRLRVLTYEHMND